jgi:hypothetical protein
MTDHSANTPQRLAFLDPLGASFRKTEELNKRLARMVEVHNGLTRMPEIHSAFALHEYNERVSRMQNVMEQLREEQARAEAEAREAQSAAGCVRRLEAQIRLFESKLDAEQDVGIRLVNFGSEITFHVTDIGSVEPDLIVFSGKTQAGAPVRLLQHRNQIDFLLTTLKRSNPDQPKRSVGFHHQ